jgi:chemotaxis-related protein WspD
MLENGLSQRPTEEDVIDACWSRIGVRGDQSCPRLQDFFRCLNCPTYAASAAQLLDRPTRTELAAANLNWQGEQTEAAGQGCVSASAMNGWV